MKKILFLLLCSVVMYGQVPADATPIENIQLTNNVISNGAPFVSVQESSGVVNKITKTELQDAFYFATASALPVVGITDKLYITRDDNKLYRFNGTIYVPLSADISGKEDIANKSQTLTASATLYPSNNAVIDGLATKQNTISGTTNVVPKFGTGGLVNSTISEDANGVLIQGNYVGANIAPLVVKNNTPYGSPFTQMVALFQNSIGNNLIALRADGVTTFQSFASMASLSIRDLGTASTASIRLGNVNGTGFFSPSANAIGFTAGGTEAGRIHTSRRWSFGSTTDDGINIAQFNGTVKASPAVTDDQLATLGQVIPNNGILEFNSVDKTVWNNGKGNLVENTSFGALALKDNTTGNSNTANGYGSLNINTTGNQNSAFGFYSMFFNTTGNNNTGIGTQALFASNGSNNTALGNSAGRYVQDGNVTNPSPNNSVFIGAESRTMAVNQNNEIVIGYNAVGAGSNTVTIGNTNITSTILRGTVTASPATASNHLVTKAQTLYNSQTITANKTVTIAEFANNNELILSVDSTSGNITVTLPTFNNLRGYKLTVKKMDSSANSVLIQSVGGINIDGASSVIISGQYSKATVGANLAQYIIL